MVFVRMSKSCCGCSLQTGTKIIGYFCSVSGLLNWILLFFEFSIMNWGGFSDDENEQTTFLAQPQASLALLIIGSIVSIFFFITSVMLTTAAYKCRSYLIVPWLVTIGVYGVYEVFSVIVSIVYFEFVVAVFSASTIGIQIYFFTVVYSYYRELREASSLRSDHASNKGKVLKSANEDGTILVV